MKVKKNVVKDSLLLTAVWALWMIVFTGIFITPAHEWIAKFSITFLIIGMYSYGRIQGEEDGKDHD